MSKMFRRVVTGHDAAGQAVIQSDGFPKRVVKLSGGGPVFYELWNTRETPARIDRSGTEPHEDSLTLLPPRNGTRIRVLDIPPETREMGSVSAATGDTG